MKKEICAAILLILLFTASLVNIHCLDMLTGEVAELAEEAGQFALSGQWTLARSSAEKARETWGLRNTYTHMVLRHSEIEDASSVLGDLLKSVYEENNVTASVCARLAADRIRSVASIEKIRLGSIF